jgi:uncharacterized phiE125 gp8 family phage protein
MLAPVLVTPPQQLPVLLDEIKAQVPQFASESDDLAQAFIEACSQALDGWRGSLGGMCLVTQTWRSSFDRFPCGASYSCGTMQNVLRLPFLPVISIASVKYYDSAGVLQTVSSSTYRILTDALGPMVASVPDAAAPWPAVTVQSRVDAVAVEAVYGFGGPADVPQPIKTAIALKVGRLHSLSRRDANVRSQNVVGVGSREFGSTETIKMNTEAEEALLFNYRRRVFG